MAQPVTTLLLEDEQTYADFGTFVARARSLDDAAAMRLQADGLVLAAYVPVLEGRGLLGDGTIVGLRVSRLAEPAHLDVTVPLAALADRLSRTPVPGATDARRALAVPPTTLQTAWGALTPPRSGWELVGSVSAEELTEVARHGIEEIARAVDGTAQTAGAHVVAELRARVWGRLTTTVPPVVSAAAFAAYALGFLVPQGECSVAAHGRWTRVSSPRGHVLVR